MVLPKASSSSLLSMTSELFERDAVADSFEGNHSEALLSALRGTPPLFRTSFASRKICSAEKCPSKTNLHVQLHAHTPSVNWFGFDPMDRSELPRCLCSDWKESVETAPNPAGFGEIDGRLGDLSVRI